MEEDGQETPRSPFWIQSTTNLRRIERYRRRLSSLFFNSGLLIILLLLLALFSLLYIIPSLISFSSHIFIPNLVKKSWDSINFILVFFALAVGFLSRNINNGDNISSDLIPGEAPISSPSSSTPHQWYDFPDQSISFGNGLRRHRTSSSYPDLRELSPPWNHREADAWRFSDDTHLNTYRSLDSERHYLRREQSSETLSLPPQPPAPTPKKSIRIAQEDEDRSRGLEPNKPLSPETEPPMKMPSFEDFEQKGSSGDRKRANGERRRARSLEPRKMFSPINNPAPEPSSSPPSALPLSHDFEPKNATTEKKKIGANASREFFTSFYHKKKKKRQRQRSVDNFDNLLHLSKPPDVTFQPPSPPAPAARKPTTTRLAPFITEKPRLPVNKTIDDSSSGGESPLKRIPPPPPLPPFKMPDWKFTVEGDYVRLQSTLSSRSGSPDGDEAQSPSSDVDAAAAALFCPSPDVDTKADSFIERFRAGLKLEKNISFNQNQGFRRSNLGPGPRPSQF